jgi:SAM-dependent methyltransferase
MFQVASQVYDRFMGRYGPELSAGLIAFAGVERGRALDVGCGPGSLTAALAERLGADSVAAVDPSAPFVSACRARVPGAEVVQGRAEELPFADKAFDAALSQLVVNFMADPEAGVREMARVTRPGGVVCACVWDYGDGMRMLRAFWDASVEVEPERGAAADEARLMTLRSPDKLAELWDAAGLADVRTGPLDSHAEYDGFDDLWWPFTLGVGPAGALVVSLDDDRQAALRDAMRRRLGVGDEPFRLSARAWAVAGVSAPAAP